MPITNINAGQAVVQIIGNDSQLQDVLKKAGAGLQGFAQKWTAIGARLQAAGQMMFAPFQEAMRVFADFDDQMRRVAAVSGATGQAFAMLTKQAKVLGASTAFTASQVAAGMASLGMMGFSPAEINGAMESVMALSRATSIDLAEAASIAANQLRVFGMSAADTEKVADILAATANGSAQTLTDLGEALKVAGPLAKITGQDLRQVAGALGVLANMGIRGAMAGTAIARSYKQMADPAVQLRMRQLGVEVLDINGNLRDMAQIWAELGKKLATMTNAEQLATLKEVFNDRGMLGGGLLSFNSKSVDDFMAKLRQCDGYVAQTAEQMEGGLGGALRGLSSAWEAVKIAIGESVSALSPLISALAATARAFAVVLRWTGPLIPVLATVSAGVLAIGAAMAAAGVATSAYSLSIGKVLTPAILANIKFHVQFNALLVQEQFAALAAAGGNTMLAKSLAVVKLAAMGVTSAMKALWAVIAANPYAAAFAAIAVAIMGVSKALTYSMDRASNQAIDAAESVLSDNGKEPQTEEEVKARLKELSSARQKLADEMNAMSNGWKSRIFRGAAEANVQKMKGEFDALSQEYDRQMSRLEEMRRGQTAFVAAGGVDPEQAARQQEIENQLADERLTSVEREIAANEELRKELLAVYEARLMFARGDRQKTAALRAQIVAANAQFDERRAAIVARGAKAAGFIDVAADLGRRSAAREKSAAQLRQDRELDALRERGGAAYQARLRQLIASAGNSVSEAARELAALQNLATSATSDGGAGVTEAEKAAIEAQRELYREAQDALDRLQGKMDEAETEPQKVAERVEAATRSSGSFSARALDRLVGRNPVQERIAEATRRTAEYLARITELDRQKLRAQNDFNNALGTV